MPDFRLAYELQKKSSQFEVLFAELKS